MPTEGSIRTGGTPTLGTPLLVTGIGECISCHPAFSEGHGYSSKWLTHSTPRPVHHFLLRFAYHSSISMWKISRPSATLLTFLLSACVHELVMAIIFDKIRGYLFCMQLLQLPLIQLSRTKFLAGRYILGNVQFWIGIFFGPSFLCSLYLFL